MSSQAPFCCVGKITLDASRVIGRVLRLLKKKCNIFSSSANYQRGIGGEIIIEYIIYFTAETMQANIFDNRFIFFIRFYLRIPGPGGTMHRLAIFILIFMV